MLFKRRWFFLFLVLCYGAVGASAQSLPVYEVARVTSEINVDGKLNEKAWADAKPAGAFLNNRDGSRSELETEAHILYDQRFIYFAFRVVDQNVWATMKRRDEHLWLEEVVEVILEGNPALPNYIERSE